MEDHPMCIASTSVLCHVQCESRMILSNSSEAAVVFLFLPSFTCTACCAGDLESVPTTFGRLDLDSRPNRLGQRLPVTSVFTQARQCAILA